eukprot:scaffold6914_cov155-Skeletonema_marinoi.AAC.3
MIITTPSHDEGAFQHSKSKVSIMGLSKWLHPLTAQKTEDGTYDPSPFTLALGTSTKTSYIAQNYEQKYTGGYPHVSILENESNPFDIIYLASEFLTPKEQALRPYVPRWLLEWIQATKIGVVFADSYDDATRGTQHQRRLATLDTGSPISRISKPIYVPKDCGLMCESMVHKVFYSLEQGIGGGEKSCELFSISSSQREYIVNFFKIDGAFGVKWDQMRNVSPQSQTGQRLTATAMTNVGNELQKMRRLKEEFEREMRDYIPESSTNDTSTSINSFFVGDFDQIMNGHTHPNIVVFRHEQIASDAELKAKLEGMQFGIYMVRVVIPEGAEITPQSYYFLARHKLGRLEGGINPITRLYLLGLYTPFPLEMMFVDLQSQELAEAAEAYFHNRYGMMRRKNEWFYALLVVAREWFGCVYNYLTGNGPSPLNGLLTIENVSDENSDPNTDLTTGLNDIDHYGWVLDPILRSIVPTNINMPSLTKVIKTTTIRQKWQSLSEVQFTNLLIRLMDICKAERSITGARLIKVLATDQYLGFHYGRDPNYVQYQIESWFPKIFRIDMKMFKKTNRPAEMICNEMCMTGLTTTLIDLQFDTLHQNWPLLLSNAHRITTHSQVSRSI